MLVLITWTVYPQSLKPLSSTIEINESTRPCIALTIDPEPKELKKAWVKFLKKEYSIKLKEKGFFGSSDILCAEEVQIDELILKQMDFYTQIVEVDNGSEMKIFASLGYDIYLNETDYPAEFKMLSNMFVSFLKQYLPVYYEEDIKRQTQNVKKLKKEINSLEANMKRDTEKIAELTEDVEDYRKSVENNSEKLDVAENKLKDREEKLERIKAKLQAL
jgi:uncharacterized coiled-coil protein SlyX